MNPSASDMRMAAREHPVWRAAHYAEEGRWESEQLLAPSVVGDWERTRYFDVVLI